CPMPSLTVLGYGDGDETRVATAVMDQQHHGIAGFDISGPFVEVLDAADHMLTHHGDDIARTQMRFHRLTSLNIGDEHALALLEAQLLTLFARHVLDRETERVAAGRRMSRIDGRIGVFVTRLRTQFYL